MKKYILPLLGTLCIMFMGCNKASQSMTSDEALQAFQNQVDSFTELVKSYEANPSDSLLAVVEYEYECFVDSSLAIMEQVPNSEANYTILKEIYYSLTTEQKTRAFACVDIDKLEEKKLLKLYTAYTNLLKTDVGQMYIDFVSYTPQGDSVHISQYIGLSDWTLIDFWASWCRPCRESMPALKQLYTEANGKLTIVGVSLDNDKEKWLGSFQTLDMPWTHVSDLKGWDAECAQLYGVNSIPCTVLLNKAGEIVARSASIEEMKKIILQ